MATIQIKNVETEASALNDTDKIPLSQNDNVAKVVTPVKIHQYVKGKADTAPTEGSSNLVTSGGVKTALDAKADESEVSQIASEVNKTTSDLIKFDDELDNGNKLVLGYTLSPGYISATGIVSSQSALGEMYSSQIDVSQGEHFTIKVSLATDDIGSEHWVAIAKYGDNGFIERTKLNQSETVQNVSCNFTIGAGVTSIVIMARTFSKGSTAISLITESNIEKRIDSLDATIGSEPLNTTDQTLKGAINEVLNDVGDVDADAKKAMGIVTALPNGYSIIPCSIEEGFITATGAVAPNTADGVVYSSMIEVAEGDVIYVDLTLDSAPTADKPNWLALGTYVNSESSTGSRIILINTTDANLKTHNEKKYVVTSGVGAIRVSARLYSGGSLVAKKVSALREDVENMENEFEKIDKHFNLPDIVTVSARTNTTLYATTTYAVDLPQAKGAIQIRLDNWDRIANDGRIFIYLYAADQDTKVVKSITPSSKSVDVVCSFDVKYIGFYLERKYILSNGELLFTFYQDFPKSIESRVEVLEKKGLISSTVRTVAHRGDDIVAPQCTAPAYIAARKRGITIAENDLAMTNDGDFVMWHDSGLRRLDIDGGLVDINGYLMYTDGTDYYWYNSSDSKVYSYDDENEEYVEETGVALTDLTRCEGNDYGVRDATIIVNGEPHYIKGLNLSILKRIDFGAYKGDVYKGTQILTFEEWVLLCKQLGMEIYIDRKFDNYTNQIISDAANIVKKLGMGDYSSWLGLSNGIQINYLRTIIDGARCGFLHHPYRELTSVYAAYNIGRGIFFDGDAKTMDGQHTGTVGDESYTATNIELIEEGLLLGFDVEVYYVDASSGDDFGGDSLTAIRTAVGNGVTGMTLDHYRVDEAFGYLMD